MRKLGRILMALWFVLALAAPVSAAVKLAGTWSINNTFIDPDGIIHTPPAFTLNLTQSPPPNSSLYYGTMVVDGAINYMTLQMDTGNSFHFAISLKGESDSGYVTTTYGRGTASTKSVTGSWSNDLGYTGTFTGTKQ